MDDLVGPPDVIDRPYPALDELPEIVAAQRAHLRLLHRRQRRPWPTRDSPPGPRGGRSLLGPERKIFTTPRR